MEVIMSRNTKLVQYFLVFALLITLTVTPANLKVDAASSGTNTTIDDFENYTLDNELKSAYGLWSSEGNGAEWSLNQEQANDGTNSMKIVANEPLDSWVSVS